MGQVRVIRVVVKHVYRCTHQGGHNHLERWYVTDEHGYTLPTSADVCWELHAELLRLGAFFRASLLYDEDAHQAVGIQETKGPTLINRFYRFFWRKLGYGT